MAPYVGDRRVLTAIYGSLLLPFIGPVLLAVGSSVAYYRLRGSRPGLASWLNLHAWIAILLNVVAHVVLVLAVRR